jgi:hypothetical protein
MKGASEQKSGVGSEVLVRWEVDERACRKE